MVKLKTAMAITAGLLLGTTEANNATRPAENIPNAAAKSVNDSHSNNTQNEQTNINPKVLNIGDSRTVGMYFSENKT